MADTYITRTYTEADAQPTVVHTVIIDGVSVDVIAHTSVTQDHIDDTPKFAPGRRFQAAATGTYTLLPAERSFQTSAGRDPGHWATGRGTSIEPYSANLGDSATVAGAVAAARATLAARALKAEFGPLAIAVTRTLTADEWKALPVLTNPKRRDVVAVPAFGRIRRGVVVKVGRTRLHVMYATPAGGVPMTCTVAATNARDARS